MTTENKLSQALPVPEQQTLSRSIVLHLLPGVLILLFYLFTARTTLKMGFPPMMALLFAIAVVLIPFELGYVLYQGKKQHGKISISGVILYREHLQWWYYLILGSILFLWLGFAFRVLAKPIDTFFIDKMFRWVPDWFFLLGPHNDLSGFSKSALLITAIMAIVFNGIAGPVVEEIYFRGYLLPRISRLNGWAPLLNLLLFSLYHLFTPWQNLVRIIGFVPMVYSVWWKRNIHLGMIVHCAGNMVGSIGMLVMVLNRS